MPLSNGETFAEFRIVRPLGSGGMGEVYLVQHPRLPKYTALKILPAATSSDAEFRERFGREADLSATLYHPHIVGVHDRGEFDGQLWISMDFVDGEDAGSLLTDRHPDGMPTELVIAIVTSVGSALDYAHERGLLHRDVKPANIMLTHVDDGGEPRILLTDFGIARTIDDDSGLTATNMTIGTVAYTSPEQLMGRDVDGRADQYSLASTAYQLLTGQSLFAHTNAAVVISRHLSSPPPALADARPELARLDAVLSTALAKDPNRRFGTCSEFARALADPSALAEAPTSAAPGPPVTREPTPPSEHAATSLIATTPPVKLVSSDAPESLPVTQAVAPVALSPGWYVNPDGRGETRYWDGRDWHAAAAPPGRPANRNGPVLGVLAVAVVLLLVGSLVYLSTRDDGPTATSRSPAASSSYQSAGGGASNSPVNSPTSPAVAPGLARFVGRWTTHSGLLTIRQTGSGHMVYTNQNACPTCSAAEAPVGTVDFTLTSVTGNKASGLVEASSDEHEVAVGADVTALLVAGSPSGQVVHLSLGRMQDFPFCDDTSQATGECGA